MLRLENRTRSATRAELDQRSRDARLQLEALERQVLAQLRAPSGLRRLAFWLRWQIGGGRRSTGTSTMADPASRSPHGGMTPARGGEDADLRRLLGLTASVLLAA